MPVPRQALAAATLAVGPGQGADGKKESSVELCEKMVRLWVLFGLNVTIRLFGTLMDVMGA